MIGTLIKEIRLKHAVVCHLREKGLKVRMESIRLGNTMIDGEVEGKSWRMALEIKTPTDDLTRGLSQLAEAKAFGYKNVALVTSFRAAKRIDPTIFEQLGLVSLGVDSKGMVHQIYPTYA